MHILIVGGTGTTGRVLAERARANGHLVRTLSRRPAERTHGPHHAVADLTTGAGLDEAVAGIDAVVDVSNIATARYRPAATFFTTAAENLLAAEQRAGVGHHLTLSIVGVDRFPAAYYRAKVAQEAAVTAASARTGVAATIARVTQFHDFAAQVAQRFRVGRLVVAPPLHAQPVHLDDVADHLLGLLAQAPGGFAPELGGPEPQNVRDMVRRFATAVDAPVRVVPAPLFGATRRANESGVLRPSGGVRGTLTFEHWLGEVRSWPKQRKV